MRNVRYAVLLAAVAFAMAACATAAPSSPVASSPAAPVATSSAAAPAPSSAAASPSMTAEQQQAVESAQGYLSMGSGFSKEGLLQQLTSSAGEGFPMSDARFAISYLQPDWNQQAVESAKGYMQMGGFSRADLYQQLTSSAGEGFTPSQANYALSKVGM